MESEVMIARKPNIFVVISHPLLLQFLDLSVLIYIPNATIKVYHSRFVVMVTMKLYQNNAMVQYCKIIYFKQLDLYGYHLVHKSIYNASNQEKLIVEVDQLTLAVLKDAWVGIQDYQILDLLNLYKKRPKWPQ